ncbi:hypothetical protein [Chryseobacterium sp. ZHDP1]|uniref:hypothetical protein n=1 Tax=Chryseobacterium sp. ZHDP1 TaxID=2838877 RepID=UPI001BDFCDD8|nr:hypothetical protein [Chryseobacterium sp. ZHDP1]QWA38870.1 hypothetical protein KKI44_01260 [Chryseobacterium sp. ZHDP1]
MTNKKRISKRIKILQKRKYIIGYLIMGNGSIIKLRNIKCGQKYKGKKIGSVKLFNHHKMAWDFTINFKENNKAPE